MFMILDYACCNVSVMPLRKDNSHRSEQVSQVLFGEKVEIKHVDESGWAQIRTKWDEYDGWCNISQLSTISQKEYLKDTRYLTLRNSDKILINEEVEMWIPIGSELKKSNFHSAFGTIYFKGKKKKLEELDGSAEGVIHAAKLFLDAPYQWGGRSVAGIDCSGLTQMAYKLGNKKLPRDASQQAAVGNTIDFLQNAKSGDLAFFDNEDGKINHVGLLIDAQTIIHATEVAGRVVIDKIDQGGIISTRLRKRTHNLRLVKRYL